MARGRGKQKGQFAAEARSTLQSTRGASRQSVTQDVTGMVRHFQDELISFWGKYKEQFTDWWTTLPQRDKVRR